MKTAIHNTLTGMTTTKLKVIKCSDSMMWYNNQIGKTFPCLGQENDYYISREPGGLVNIIKKSDAIQLWQQN